MTERFNITMADGTRAKLEEMGVSERKIGETLSALVDAEWKRRQYNIVMMAQRLEQLEREVEELRAKLARKD